MPRGSAEGPWKKAWGLCRHMPVGAHLQPEGLWSSYLPRGRTGSCPFCSKEGQREDEQGGAQVTPERAPCGRADLRAEAHGALGRLLPALPRCPGLGATPILSTAQRHM